MVLVTLQAPILYLRHVLSFHGRRHEHRHIPHASAQTWENPASRVGVLGFTGDVWVVWPSQNSASHRQPSGVAKSALEEDIYQVSASIEDGQHMNRVTLDSKNHAVRRDDKLPEKLDSYSLEFRHNAPASRKAFKTFCLSLELTE